jgi:hypothetical protein
MGVCIDTSECASEGGTSTADYCPGPSNIQCCTGIKVKDAGASDGSSGGKADAGSGGDAGGITPGGDAGASPDGGAGNADQASGPGSSGGCACSLE